MVRWCWVSFQYRGVLLIWSRVGQWPTALAVGAGGSCLDIFSLVYHFFFLSPSLWETARYRLKYCLKGPLSPKQPTNQLSPSLWETARYRLKCCLKGPLNPKPTNVRKTSKKLKVQIALGLFDCPSIYYPTSPPPPRPPKTRPRSAIGRGSWV